MINVLSVDKINSTTQSPSLPIRHIHELCALTQGGRNDSLKEQDATTLRLTLEWRSTSSLPTSQTRFWPGLLNELRQTLELISCEPLSPGLRSAWRQVMKRL